MVNWERTQTQRKRLSAVEARYRSEYGTVFIITTDGPDGGCVVWIYSPGTGRQEGRGATPTVATVASYSERERYGKYLTDRRRSVSQLRSVLCDFEQLLCASLMNFTVESFLLLTPTPLPPPIQGKLNISNICNLVNDFLDFGDSNAWEPKPMASITQRLLAETGFQKIHQWFLLGPVSSSVFATETMSMVCEFSCERKTADGIFEFDKACFQVRGQEWGYSCTEWMMHGMVTFSIGNAVIRVTCALI